MPQQPHALRWPLDKLQIHVINGGRLQRAKPGEEKQLLRVSGESAASTHMTLTLFQEAIEDGTPLAPATAIIKWGNDGTKTQAEVDFKQGTMITIPAGFVEVIGRNDDPVIDARLGAFVGYMPYFRQFSATKTEVMPIAGGGTPSNVVIPPFAISMAVAVSPTNALASIEFRDGAGALIGGYQPLVGAVETQYEIPNDARSVDINATAIAITGGRVIFNLAL